MKMVVMAVFDKAADGFMRPIFVPSVGTAVRSFQDEVNRNAQDNQMFSHPGDFDIFELGSWNDADGKFDMLEMPRLVARGVQLSLKEAGVTPLRSSKVN